MICKTLCVRFAKGEGEGLVLCFGNRKGTNRAHALDGKQCAQGFVKGAPLLRKYANAAYHEGRAMSQRTRLSLVNK